MSAARASVPGFAVTTSFLVLGAMGLWRIAGTLPERSTALDFSHYYASGSLLLRGQDPYRVDLREEVARSGLQLEGVVFRATNPPPLIALSSPLALLPPGVAHSVWTGVQVACLAALLWLTVTIGGLSPQGGLCFAGAALFSYAVYSHFYYAQTQLLIGALLLVALRFLISDRPVPAVLLVGVTGLLKLFPLLLLPWFVWAVRSPGKRRLAAAGVVLFIGAVVALQWPLWLSFFRSAPPVIAAAVEGLPFNFSLPSVLLRLGVPGVWAAWPGLMLLGGGYLVCLRAGRERPVEQLALLTCLTVAATATAWGHYHVLLLFPFALFAREVWSRLPTLRGILVIWVVYMLVLYLAHLPGVYGGVLVLLAALPLYGNLGLAGYWAWRLA